MRNPFQFLARGRKSDRLTPDGLQITEFPPSIVNLLRVDGVGGSYGQIYASQQNIRTTVDLIARECAELTVKLYEKVPRPGQLGSSRVELDEHPMMQVLDEPTPGESTYDFWYSLFADILVYDLALWQKVRLDGEVAALVRIPPAILTPIRDPFTQIVTGWRAADGTVIPNGDLVVFWGYDPSTNHGSISPMETLRRLLSEDIARDSNRVGMWRNALRKDGVIEQDAAAQPMNDESAQSFLLDISDSLTGASGSGRPALLLPGMRWQDISWSPKDAEYLGSRKLTRVEVAAAYHVPPALVAAAENGAQPDDGALDYLYTSTLPPLLSRVEATINAKLLPEFTPSRSVRKNQYVEFNLDSKLRGQFEKKAAIMATTAGGPIITVNEARARLNLPPVEGGDLMYVPLNSMRAGGPQGSPQAPVATPTPGLEPAGTTPGGGSAPAPDSSASIEEVMKKHEEHVAKQKDAAEHAIFMREGRAKFSERGSGVYQKLFTRQRNSVQGGKEFNEARWNRELADDLFGFYYQVVETFGEDAAKRMSGEWSSERTANFLKAKAETVAKNTNAATKEALAAEDPDLDTIFGEGRASRFGSDATTWAMNWSLTEAVHQNSD